MDRGWYKRTHDAIKNNPKDFAKKDELKKLHGFGVVLALAITCGVGWLVSGALAIVAGMLNNKLLGFASGGAFAVFYIIFIGLFSAAWVSVRKMNKDCLNHLCKNVRRHGKRSSYEVLAYSVCAFILILVSIILSIIGSLGLGQNDSGTDGEKKEDVAISTRPLDEIPPVTEQPVESKKIKEVSLAGRNYIDKFSQLNKYIVNKDKMQKYADKKFDQTDTDKSGSITMSEFKVFVTDIMVKKKLPPPSDRKIEALMKRYDTDKSKSLEKNEFHMMLLEIFTESRELLAIKYAEKKAEAWKAAKAPAHKEESKLEELNKLLNNSEEFYKVLDNIAKESDQNKNEVLELCEVTEMIRIFCYRYKVPAMSKDEVEEVMFDMGRDVKGYNVNDLRMAALAVLSISRNLAK